MSRPLSTLLKSVVTTQSTSSPLSPPVQSQPRRSRSFRHNPTSPKPKPLHSGSKIRVPHVKSVKEIVFPKFTQKVRLANPGYEFSESEGREVVKSAVNNLYGGARAVQKASKGTLKGDAYFVMEDALREYERWWTESGKDQSGGGSAGDGAGGSEGARSGQ